MWLWSQQICYVLRISLSNIHIWKHNFSISLYCSYFKVHSLNILRRVTMASFKPEQRNRFTTCGFYFHHRVAPFVLPKHEPCFFVVFFSLLKMWSISKTFIPVDKPWWANLQGIDYFRTLSFIFFLSSLRALPDFACSLISLLSFHSFWLTASFFI